MPSPHRQKRPRMPHGNRPLASRDPNPLLEVPPEDGAVVPRRAGMDLDLVARLEARIAALEAAPKNKVETVSSLITGRKAITAWAEAHPEHPNTGSLNKHGHSYWGIIADTAEVIRTMLQKKEGEGGE